MKRIRIADTTLCGEGTFTFREKIEIARQLDKLQVDVIDLPAITQVRQDTLLVHTIASFVQYSEVSVEAGLTPESIDLAAAALEGAKKPCIRIQLPVSSVGMEYTCRKKPEAMLSWLATAVSSAKGKGMTVEFCAVDATRADDGFLEQAIAVAVSAGADRVAVCDSTGQRLPDDFAAFIADLSVTVPLGVGCNNQNGLACAQAILAVQAGATYVKTAIDSTAVPLETFVNMVHNCGEHYGFSTDIRYTEMRWIIQQIQWVAGGSHKETTTQVGVPAVAEICLDAKDDQTAVITAVAKLGYDLSEEDQARVYEEFCRVAEKKTVAAKELEAIVASVALQVPDTYRLVSYVVNNGNIISTSAQIALQKGEKTLQGVCIGDGPIDAAFRAIDQIVGCHYELDDFQIQAVTQGKEAVGQALVKLRDRGQLYSGTGISTDIIGASIRAYLNALNKIVYEEG